MTTLSYTGYNERGMVSRLPAPDLATAKALMVERLMVEKSDATSHREVEFSIHSPGCNAALTAWDMLLRGAVATEFPALPDERDSDLDEWVRTGAGEACGDDCAPLERRRIIPRCGPIIEYDCADPDPEPGYEPEYGCHCPSCIYSDDFDEDGCPCVILFDPDCAIYAYHAATARFELLDMCLCRWDEVPESLPLVGADGGKRVGVGLERDHPEWVKGVYSEARANPQCIVNW